MVDDAFIRFGGRMMHFVDENVIELVCVELCKRFRTRHRLHGGERVFAIRFLAATRKQAEFAFRASKHFLERFFSFLEDLLLLRDVQHAIRFDLPHVER